MGNSLIVESHYRWFKATICHRKLVGLGTRIWRKIHEIERATKWPRKLQRTKSTSPLQSLHVCGHTWMTTSFTIPLLFLYFFFLPFPFLSSFFLLPFFFFSFLSYFLHFPSLFFTFPFLFSVPFPLPVLVLSSFHFLSSSSSFPLFLPFSLFFPLPFLVLWWVDEVCEETVGKDIASARHNLLMGLRAFTFHHERFAKEVVLTCLLWKPPFWPRK